jgi:hypothetical protein
MKQKSALRIYGENAATFLIFQALANCPGAIAEIFLSRLKRFGSGIKGKWQDLTDIEVWLFPNFGKGYGFGEPDVIILAGKSVFWIEVETIINCRPGLPLLRKSLVQLWRFHLLQYAIAKGTRNERGSRRIVGYTVTNSRLVRSASVKIGRHGVFMRILNRLQEAGKQGMDHYVLFTVDKPKGAGCGKLSYGRVLEREATKIADGYPDNLPKLPVERSWYAYCKGDLAEPFYKSYGETILSDDIYVRIKQ